MPKSPSPQLTLALRDKVLISFTRPFDEHSTCGYVVDIGQKLFLIAVIGEDMRFNGFQCFRLADLRGLQIPHKYAAFCEAALHKRGEQLPKKSRVTVRSLEELLISVSRAFPLLTIHREQVDPDACQIGRAIEVNKSYISLLEIGPDACWDRHPSHYPLGEITRVDFGGDYEEALHLVGGQPWSLIQ